MDKQDHFSKLVLQNSTVFIVGGDASSVETSGSFNNKANGHQNFSSAEILNGLRINNKGNGHQDFTSAEFHNTLRINNQRPPHAGNINQIFSQGNNGHPQMHHQISSHGLNGHPQHLQIQQQHHAIQQQIARRHEEMRRAHFERMREHQRNFGIGAVGGF